MNLFIPLPRMISPGECAALARISAWNAGFMTVHPLRHPLVFLVLIVLMLAFIGHIMTRE